MEIQRLYIIILPVLFALHLHATNEIDVTTHSSINTVAQMMIMNKLLLSFGTLCWWISEVAGTMVDREHGSSRSRVK